MFSASFLVRALTPALGSLTSLLLVLIPFSLVFGALSSHGWFLLIIPILILPNRYRYTSLPPRSTRRAVTGWFREIRDRSPRHAT
jgi:hypothetical protein